jgi:thiol-disulfide isomerase/thioredoxin
MVSARKIILFIILVCSFRIVTAQTDLAFSGEKLSSFRLYDPGAGKSFQLPVADASKAFSVFIFLSPECPLSQNYLPLLNRLRETYSDDISFYGIIPGRAYAPETVKEFASTYRILFPVLIDSLKFLTSYMDATVTPEIIFLNNKNVLVYKGAVDDLLTGLGKRKIKAANEYLKNAIVQSLENKEVSIKRTKAVGCKINDY